MLDDSLLPYDRLEQARAAMEKANAKVRNLRPRISEGTPCNGCTLCCRYETITLRPEWGDDPSKYQTEVLPDGRTVLQRQANGDCIYLDRNTGCTIHKDAPYICRDFDCRVIYIFRNTPHVKRLLDAASQKLGVRTYPVLERGKELVTRRLQFHPPKKNP